MSLTQTEEVTHCPIRNWEVPLQFLERNLGSGFLGMVLIPRCPRSSVEVQRAELRLTFGHRASANPCQRIPQKTILPDGLWEISRLCFDLIFQALLLLTMAMGT